MCYYCPTGWVKFNSYCFHLQYSTLEHYQEQVANCAQLQITYSLPYVPTVWMPKTEDVIIFGRFYIEVGPPNWSGLYWIGMYKNGTR